MVWFSFFGIVAALVVIIYGTLRGHSLILVSTIAALVCAITGAIATVAMPGLNPQGSTLLEVFYNGYAVSYMQGVADIVISLFPLFLAGQIFGKLLEKTDLPLSIAGAVFQKLGPRGTVTAVFIASLLLCLGGINVYVIVFTMYPLAAAFFKEAGITRSLIPACILAGATVPQTMPGVPIFNLVIPAEAFGVTPSAGFRMGAVAALVVFLVDLIYLNWAGSKSLASKEGFVDKAGAESALDIHAQGLPNPWLFFVPLAFVIILVNVFAVPAWASLFVGCLVVIVMFYKRLEGRKSIVNLLTQSADSSQGVVSVGAICGVASMIGAVPGFQILLDFLESSSFGSPYIMAALAVAVIAGFSGSALGGIQFVLANFAQSLMATGASPAALTRIVAVSSLTFDSLPHNPACILTLQHCGVSQREGYKHIFFISIVSTFLATVVTVFMAQLGIV